MTGRPWLSALPEGECSPSAQPSPSRTAPDITSGLSLAGTRATPVSGTPHDASRAASPARSALCAQTGHGHGRWGSHIPRPWSVVPARPDLRPTGRAAPRGCAAHRGTFAAGPRAGPSAPPTLEGRGSRPRHLTSVIEKDLTDQFDGLDAVWGRPSRQPEEGPMASFESIASGIADHSGACVDAPTVPLGFETRAARPSRRPVRRGDAS